MQPHAFTILERLERKMSNRVKQRQCYPCMHGLLPNQLKGLENGHDFGEWLRDTHLEWLDIHAVGPEQC